MPDSSWIFEFPRTWYETYRLKRQRKLEGWSDLQYYEAMFSLSRLVPEIEGDKFAAYRDLMTAELPSEAGTGRVLDLATGVGYQARNTWLHGRREVYACDLVQSRIDRARERSASTGIRYLVCSMEQLAFPRGSFPAILISAALHDLPAGSVAAVLGECGRLLSPGGRLIVMEPSCVRDIPLPLFRALYAMAADGLDESVNILDFIHLDLVELAGRSGLALLKKRKLWHGLLCLYTFERSA